MAEVEQGTGTAAEIDDNTCRLDRSDKVADVVPGASWIERGREKFEPSTETVERDRHSCNIAIRTFQKPQNGAFLGFKGWGSSSAPSFSGCFFKELVPGDY